MSEIKWFVKESVFSYLESYSSDFGWGNGYVALPQGHPWYNVPYQEIDIDIHGGLTFGSIISGNLEYHFPNCKGMYVIGFDTAHYGDNKYKWTKEMVEKEAQKLCEICKSVTTMRLI